MRQMHNFKRQIIAILTCGILTATNSAQGQNRQQEIKDFFNQLDDGFYVKQQILVLDSVQVVWRQIISLSIRRKTKIAEQDIQYILNQMDSSAGKIWTKEIFKKAKIVSGQQIDRKTKEIGDVPTFYAFSTPYFTHDNRYCIIYQYASRSGKMCVLYEKVGAKWLPQTVIENIAF